MVTAGRTSEVDILTTLAEYRVMTQAQIAALHFGTHQGPRRRLAEMVSRGLISKEVLVPRQSRPGGQERVFFCQEEGLDFLKNEGVLPKTVSYDNVGRDALGNGVEHQLLVNWVQIHLAEIPRAVPDVATDFHSSKSPFALKDDHTTTLLREPGFGDKGENLAFIPDGVFTVSSAAQGLALLFFLEADMGTEPLARRKRSGSDIRQKIIKYQTYFREKRFKPYERIFGAEFDGFRLLFVADDPNRLSALCGLVKSMPPKDFIWLTDKTSMFSQGLADEIWLRGGNLDAQPQSILGPTLYCSSPIPPAKTRFKNPA